MNLRKAARGRQCQVRLAGVCNHDESTVVLAHYRLAGLSGMGMKSPDPIGARLWRREWVVYRFETEGHRLAMNRRRLCAASSVGTGQVP
jgi:hypothetical protein